MKKYRAIGLMSGTSMDGIDLSLIESDGINNLKLLKNYYQPYQDSFKEELFKTINNQQGLFEIKNIENELTYHHVNIVNDFLKQNNLSSADIDIIGFHGQTIYHNPQKSITWQIGNAHILASQTQIDVIADLRSRDVALGGNGAPLVPIYHFHLLKHLAKTNFDNIALLNIGGVSNISIFNKNDENSLSGFDVCFGNALLDDLISQRLNLKFDSNGELTIKGIADIDLSNKILQNSIFHQPFPRAFDRQDFHKILSEVKNLEIADALATYSFILANALKIAIEKLPIKPEIIYVCGGGRKNLGLMKSLSQILERITVNDVDSLSLDGDFIESQAFAFLAIRSLNNLPITFAKTTGLKKYPHACGGVFYSKSFL